MKPKKTQLLRGIIFLILGLLIAIQIKTIQHETYLTNRQKDLKLLQEFLKAEKENTLALENKLKADEKLKNDYEANLLKDSGVEDLKKQLEQSRFMAGLTDVKGNGVIITLDDAKKRVIEGASISDTVIHDGDLMMIVNLLKSSGAQAISINDERLVSTSEIQCAGPTVSVNRTRYAVPFIIRAIGDADYMEATLKEPGNILDIMSIYGIEISIKKENNILISKYRI